VVRESNSASRLLINESPLQALPTLAKLIGLDRAVILQQIQYWLSISANEVAGHRWIYNTYDQWGEQFPWLSSRSVRRHIKWLESEGYLITATFNHRKGDDTKWYRINYDKLEALPLSPVANLDTPVANLDTPVAKSATPLPEITTEIIYRDNKEPSMNGLLPQLQSLPYWKAEDSDIPWLGEFTGEFPELTAQHVKECRDFYDGRRPRGKGDWKNRLRNWMKKGREFASRRTAAQGEIEQKRSSIPRDAKQGKYHRFNPPTPAELAEQKRRLDAGLPPVERSRYG
jgi:hypothetical protein